MTEYEPDHSRFLAKPASPLEAAYISLAREKYTAAVKAIAAAESPEERALAIGRCKRLQAAPFIPSPDRGPLRVSNHDTSSFGRRLREKIAALEAEVDYLADAVHECTATSQYIAAEACRFVDNHLCVVLEPEPALAYRQTGGIATIPLHAEARIRAWLVASQADNISLPGTGDWYTAWLRCPTRRTATTLVS